jgi:hypothetical protein
MQKIRSLILAAGLFASVGAGAIVLPLTHLTTPALAATPHCDPYCVGQPTAPALAYRSSVARVQMNDFVFTMHRTQYRVSRLGSWMLAPPTGRGEAELGAELLH